MEKTEREYFERIISIPTPKRKEEQTQDNYNNLCCLYEAAKHLAKKTLKREINQEIGKNNIEVILKSAEKLK